VMFFLGGFIVVYQMMQFFYKHFFGDTGYLMLTLPLRRLPLLTSKVIVAFVWLNFMLVIAAVVTHLLTRNGTNAMPSIIIISSLGLHELLAVLEINLTAMFFTLTLFFVITLANSSLFRWRVHSIVAVVAGFMYAALFFWLHAILAGRYMEEVISGWGRPVNRYIPGYGWRIFHYYSEVQQYSYTPFTFERRIVGLHVGRIPLCDNTSSFPVYFDLYRWGATLLLCVLAFFVTHYLLKKRASL
ncbi:MAG: hypothetical protein FWC92_11880, partial [Defluviitaleaceae bacterium]|nr:hypothetical protein [Defluviitaleaceae bacterium]